MELARSLALLLCRWLQGCAKMDSPAKRLHRADKVRSGVPRRAPPALSRTWTALSPAAVCCAAVAHAHTCPQGQCTDCGCSITVRHGIHQCGDCHERRRTKDHHGGVVDATAAAALRRHLSLSGKIQILAILWSRKPVFF